MESGPIYDYDLVTHGAGFNYTKAPFEILDDRNLKRIFPDEEEKSVIRKFITESMIKSTLPYYEKHTGDYFKSIHFLRFADDYHHMRQFIDDYIDGRV